MALLSWCVSASMLNEDGEAVLIAKTEPGRSKRKPLSARLMPWQWTALELNFVLVVGIIALINLNIWTVFHYSANAAAPGTSNALLGAALRVETGAVAPGIDDQELDFVGKNWIPLTDRSALICVNLDGLVKKTGETTEEEKLTWEEHGCDDLLRQRYLTWEKSSADSRSSCDFIKLSSGIKIGVSWGRASPTQKRRWAEMRCDCLYEKGWSDDCLSGDPPDAHNSTTYLGIESAARSRGEDEKIRINPAAPSGLPVVALTVGTTSRGFRWESFDVSPLFGILLPSLLRTLEEGFEFRMYIGYDLGDLFYDDPDRIESARAWVREKIELPALKENKYIRITFIRFTNVLRKPGPMFNFLAASAFGDGADYMYRVNDDTELRTLWAGAFVSALKEMTPKNLGVVGPTCPEGNYRILTHDFVHRTHKEIFKIYYPLVLSDWWMDDWISRVYPKDNTLRMPDVRVTHHTWVSGSGNPVRYHVDHGHKKFLEHELRHGHELIHDHMKKWCPSRVDYCKSVDGKRTPLWNGTFDILKQTYMDSIVVKPSRYRTWTDYDDDDYSDDAYIYEDRQAGESNNVYHQEERDKLSKRDEFENMDEVLHGEEDDGAGDADGSDQMFEEVALSKDAQAREKEERRKKRASDQRSRKYGGGDGGGFLVGGAGLSKGGSSGGGVSSGDDYEGDYSEDYGSASNFRLYIVIFLTSEWYKQSQRVRSDSCTARKALTTRDSTRYKM